MLVIDEAHHLPADLLEELRLLGNLETPHGRAVQTVLIAQPPILETLQRPDLRALAQRLTAQSRARPADAGRVGRLCAPPPAGRRRPARGADRRRGVDAAGPRPAVASRGSSTRSPTWPLTLTCDAGAGRVDAEGVLEALGPARHRSRRRRRGNRATVRSSRSTDASTLGRRAATCCRAGRGRALCGLQREVMSARRSAHGPDDRHFTDRRPPADRRCAPGRRSGRGAEECRGPDSTEVIPAP